MIEEHKLKTFGKKGGRTSADQLTPEKVLINFFKESTAILQDTKKRMREKYPELYKV